MKKSAKNVVVFLVLVGFVAALGGCAGFVAGYKQGYNSNYVNVYTRHEAKKLVEEAKGNIRLVAVKPEPLEKRISIEVRPATGVDLPELTSEKINDIKNSIVETLTKKGFEVTTGASSPSLSIYVNRYKEGDPWGARTWGSAASFGKKKYAPAEIGGDLLLTKDGSQTLLDLEIPTEITGSSSWSLKQSTSFSLREVREVFSLMILRYLNDYWKGKLAKTDS